MKSNRCLASVGVFAAVMAVVLLASVRLAGQAPPAAAKTARAWTPPRTPWGDPDVSGVFTNKDEQGIPFERPADLAGRELLSDAEFAERASRAQKQLEIDSADFVQETADISNAGAVGSATSPPPHWLDRGKPTKRTSLIVDPADGRMPPQAPGAAERAAARAAARAQARAGHGPADSWEDRSLYDRCITRGLPGSMMPAIYGNSYQIVQGPGYVAIRYEMIHETRVIPLDGRPHVSPNLRSYMGDARGHWEGNTLVVETTNFKDETAYRGANAPTLHLIEHFKAVAPDKVEWSVTVDDPATWVRPWTFAMNLTKDASQGVLEYACHEGNYAMKNILTGARADDKAAEAAAKK